MDYMTTTELAELWNISSRRIQILCKEGRIKGALLKGKMWLVPAGTNKPEDARRKHKVENNVE